MGKHDNRNMPSRLRAPRSLANREGEGVEVDVVIDQFLASDGSKVTNIGINLGAAQVPDRRYVADACAVSMAHGTVKIMFGQERIDGSAWRSLVLVQMSAASASRFLGTLSQPGSPVADPNNPSRQFGIELLASNVKEPDQAIALSANLAVVAINESEACLDFYQASPFSLSGAVETKKLALDPVVRIDLRSSLFFGLIDGLRSLGVIPRELKVRGNET